MYDTSTFQLYLRPMNIPLSWNKIIISTTFYCTETLCGDASIFIFKKETLFRAKSWSQGCLSINDINNRNLNKLSLSINLQIIQIISVSNTIIYENNNNNISIQKQLSFKWNIDDISLSEMKTSIYGKCFISFVSSIFCLRIFPNGYIKEGYIYIEI